MEQEFENPIGPSDRQIYSITGDFEWTPEREEAAILLATGHTIKETAQRVGKSESTIYNWKNNQQFTAEIDRCATMYGAASKAYRMRIINQVLREFAKENADGEIELKLGDTNLLDWIKEARMQTDGEKLDISSLWSAFAEEARSVARSGQTRNVEQNKGSENETKRHLASSTETEDPAQDGGSG